MTVLSGGGSTVLTPNGSQGAQPGQAPNKRGPKVAKPPATFAGMQQSGMARPSPQMVQQQAQASQMQAQAQAQQAAQPAQQPVPQQAAQQPAQAPSQDMNGVLRQQIMGSLQNPGQGLAEAAQSQIQRQQRALDQQFADSRSSLNENLAARGLDASTIAASGLSRLAERQGQATADMVAQIEEQTNREKGAQLQQAIANAMGLRGQDLSAEQAQNSLALQGELGRGNLALGRDTLTYNQGRDQRNFDYQAGRDQVGDQQWQQGFDRSGQQWQQGFDYQKQQDTTKNNQWQQQFDTGNQQWQSQFDYNKNTDQRNFDYRAGRDTVGDQQWNKQFDQSQNNWNKTFDYNKGRDANADAQWNKTFDFNKSNAGTNAMLQVLQGMGFKNISPTMLNSIMASLGLTMPGGGAGSVPTGASAGGGATGGAGDEMMIDRQLSELYGGF